MKAVRSLVLLLLVGVSYVGIDLWWSPAPDYANLREGEWRKRLSPEAFEILREGATEDACSGALLAEKRPGDYLCKGCGATLFSAADKYDSKTGWPSFTRPAADLMVKHRQQNTPLAVVIEVRCSVCQGHLGHVFPDGPEPTGRRYCINSGALDFQAR